MGVAGSAFQQSRTAVTPAKEKRKKTPKPQSRAVSTRRDAVRTAAKRRRNMSRQKPLGPGTRLGARQDLPITIDSDDDSDSNASLRTSASAAIRAYSVPAVPADWTPFQSNGPAASKPSIPSILKNAPNAISSSAAPSRRIDSPESSAQPSHLHHRHDQELYEERLVSVEPSSCSDFGEDPGFYKHNTPNTDLSADVRVRRAQTASGGSDLRYLPRLSAPKAHATKLQPLDQSTQPSSPTSSFADGGVELTLADIPDLDLRQKTAQLMAVAPGLPAADLFHLLVERRGHLEAAKQNVTRASQLHFTPHPPLNPLIPPRAATVPLRAPTDNQGEAENEPYIKIDLDDPVFVWDNDAPTTPPPEPNRQKQSKQARPKRSTSNMTAIKSTTRTSRTSKPAPAYARSPTFTTPRLPREYNAPSAKATHIPRTSDSAAKPHQCHGAKNPKGRGIGDINRSMRETSYDRSFIVPDDGVLDDSDDTYSESDGEGSSDIDMTDDGTDLNIDMEPEYAYNSDVLSSSGYR